MTSAFRLRARGGVGLLKGDRAAALETFESSESADDRILKATTSTIAGAGCTTYVTSRMPRSDRIPEASGSGAAIESLIGGREA